VSGYKATRVIDLHVETLHDGNDYAPSVTRGLKNGDTATWWFPNLPAQEMIVALFGRYPQTRRVRVTVEYLGPPLHKER
jgi:hypothetical protein